MKRKFLISILMIAGFSLGSMAQSGKFVSEHWYDNMFVGVGGGIQTCLNKDNFDKGIWTTLTPVIEIQAGKMMSPVWGIRADFQGLWSTLYTKVDADPGEFRAIKNKKYIAMHLDGLYNISNSLFGYNPSRLFTLSVFAGPGLSFAKSNLTNNNMQVLINVSAGLQGKFNISHCFDVALDARGYVSPSMFGTDSRSITDGAFALTGNVIYTFGGKKFVQCGGSDGMVIDALNQEINQYRAALAGTQDMLAASQIELQKMQAQTPQQNTYAPTVAPTSKVIEVAGPRAVFFKLGAAKLDAYEMVNLKLAAKVMKAYPEKVYNVTGYADKATGNPTINMRLSQQRAQAVYNVLVKEGVNPNQLKMKAMGGQPNMFGQNFLNRVTILEQ